MHEILGVGDPDKSNEAVSRTRTRPSHLREGPVRLLLHGHDEQEDLLPTCEDDGPRFLYDFLY